MTSPAGGEREHRVVYRAVADFSKFYLEAKKAREAVQSLQTTQTSAAKAQETADRSAETSQRRRTQSTAEFVRKLKESAQATAQETQEVVKAERATKTIIDTVTRATKVREEHSRATKQGRDELGRFTKSSEDTEKASDKLSKALAKHGQNSRSSIGLMIAGITALVAMAIPALGAVTYGVGAFGSAFTAAGALIAGFAVAAVGHIAQIKKAMEEAEKNGTPLAAQYQKIADALDKVKAGWAAFLDQTRQPVFTTFLQALSLVEPLLRSLVPLVASFSEGMTGAFAYIADALDSDQFAEFLTFVQQTGPRAIISFTRTLLNIGSGIAYLLQGFGQFQDGVLGGLERVTAKFAEWARQLTQTEGFRDFVDYVQSVGPQVWATLVSLGSAVVSVVQALAPLAPAVLLIVRGFADLISAIPTPVLTGLIVAVLSAVVAFKAMAIVTSIAAAIRAFSAALQGAAISARTVMAAMGGLGLALSLAATLLALVSGGNSSARKTTDDYRASVADLAEAIHKKNGAVDEEIRLMAAKKLADEDLLRLAKEVGGINLSELAGAFLGDDKAFLERLEARRRALQEQKDLLDNFYMSHDVPDPEEMRKMGITNFDPQKDINKLDEFIGKYQGIKGALNTEIDQQKFIEQIMGRQSNRLDAQAGQVKGLAAEYEKLAAKSQPEQNMDRAVAAYDAWASSVQALSDARRNEARVAESSGRSVRNALRGQEQAEKSLADAQKNTRRAQEDLTQARRDAVEQILEARRKLRDVPDTEEAARLQLARAELDFSQTMRVERPTAAGLQPGQVLDEEVKSWEIARREAALALKEAQDNLDDTLVGNDKIRQDSSDTVNRGIEGSQLVIDAKERLQAAMEAEIEANGRVRDAVEAVRDAQREAAQARDDAAAATARLEAQTYAAAAAADREALSVGLTKDQVNLYRAEMAKIRDRVETEIALLDPNDAVGKLRLIQQEIEALKLMALNPTMSFDEAWGQAKSKIDSAAAASQQAAARQADAARYEASSRLQGNGGWGDAGLAEGGRVFGPGGPKEDKVSARLSAGEFVQPTDTVNYYGSGFMEALRKRQIPQEVTQLAFAEGGLVADRGAGTLNFPFNLDIGKLDFADMMRKSGFLEKAKERINEVLGVPDLSGVDYSGPDPTGSIKALIAWAKKFDPSIVMTSGYRAGSRSNSGRLDHHSQGLAADFAGSNQAMLNVAKGFMSIKERLLQLIHSQSPGFGVNDGKDVGIGWFGSEVAGHYDHVHVAARKEALGVRDSSAPGNINEPPGAGVERWRDTVWDALGRVGQPQSYDNITLRRMNQESGGNPRAINNWDSNAMRGTPSKGLMQVIDPTFRAHRDPQLTNDIWDPLANISASMRYALSRYGSLPSAYNRAGGYAGGGMVFDPSVLTGGLNSTAQVPRAGGIPTQGAPPVITPSPVTVGAAQRGGVVFEGDVTVNNPVREPAASSLRRQLETYVSVGDL